MWRWPLSKPEVLGSRRTNYFVYFWMSLFLYLQSICRNLLSLVPSAKKDSMKMLHINTIWKTSAAILMNRKRVEKPKKTFLRIPTQQIIIKKMMRSLVIRTTLQGINRNFRLTFPIQNFRPKIRSPLQKHRVTMHSKANFVNFIQQRKTRTDVQNATSLLIHYTIWSGMSIRVLYQFVQPSWMFQHII